MPYRDLSPDRLVETVDALESRIRERFPDAGIAQVALELKTLALKARSVSLMPRSIRYSLWGARFLFLAMLAFLFYTIIRFVRFDPNTVTMPDLFQGLEAVINIVIFFAIAIGFLFSFETRILRRKTLGALYELRSLAHVIDLHQLKKDPERLLPGRIWTAASPKMDLSIRELTRYLDYSSEMLSVIGKIAALYAKDASDGVILESIDAIEKLTTSVSSKIWQKISITLTLERA